jgi:type VI protein secretion system component VasK
MSGIDIFAWVVLIVMIAVAVFIFAFMGMWPGMVAKKRGHPQAQAIQVASWVFLILGFAVWPFVLVWAYLRPIAKPLDAVNGGAGDSEASASAARIAELEERLTRLEAALEGGNAR